MRDRSAHDQQQNAESAAGQYAQVAVTAIADRQSEYAQRHYDDQHLVVQMRLREFGKEGHANDDQGQCQAMQQAYGRQCDCRAVQPIA